MDIRNKKVDGSRGEVVDSTRVERGLLRNNAVRQTAYSKNPSTRDSISSRVAEATMSLCIHVK